MKKTLLIGLLFLSLNCFASVTETITRTKMKENVKIEILLQYYDGAISNGFYYPALVIITADAITEAGNNKKQYVTTFPIGNLSETPYTLKQAGKIALKNNSALNTVLWQSLKALIIEALNEDLET